MQIRGISSTSSGTYVTGVGTGQLYLLKCDADCHSVWSFPFRDNSITDFTTSLGENAVYLAGSKTSGSDNLAFVEELSLTSSLVFFGVNPPLSFGLVAVLVSLGILGFFLFLKLKSSKARRLHPSSRTPFQSGFGSRGSPSK